MKFQKMIRIQLMLMGLGAGLLLAKPVFAQQDMDPTLFEATSAASQQDQAGFNVAALPEAAKKVSADSTAPSAVHRVDRAVGNRGSSARKPAADLERRSFGRFPEWCDRELKSFTRM